MSSDSSRGGVCSRGSEGRDLSKVMGGDSRSLSFGVFGGSASVCGEVDGAVGAHGGMAQYGLAEISPLCSQEFVMFQVV